MIYRYLRDIAWGRSHDLWPLCSSQGSSSMYTKFHFQQNYRYCINQPRPLISYLDQIKTNGILPYRQWAFCLSFSVNRCICDLTGDKMLCWSIYEMRITNNDELWGGQIRQGHTGIQTDRIPQPSAKCQVYQDKNLTRALTNQMNPTRLSNE